ncbi:unnamed protein product [Durusdinium trenchii]|uniref:Uncharacterized protein n=1 Tax=Durusdinium trenchii TaxID=1381693 RepID=A0ABP0RE33_9DINO
MPWSSLSTRTSGRVVICLSDGVRCRLVRVRTEDRSVDGTWWPNLTSSSAYCGMSFVAKYADGMSWGSDSISCIRPKDELSTLFYASSNQMQVAFSLAEGLNPQFNTSEVYLYEAIEQSTIVFEVSFSTSRETVSHLPGCWVAGLPNRYAQLVPGADYGEGYLMLSVEDVLSAAGRRMEDFGSEGAQLRLSGVEIVARVDVRNYHRPFTWPFHSWNPWRLPEARELECTVHFDVLRDQFNVVQWFHEGRRPIALQHGMRLAVVGTGSVGYVSLQQLATQVLLGFTAFGLAQTCLDYGWFYLHRQSSFIADRAFLRVNLDDRGTAAPAGAGGGVSAAVSASKKGQQPRTDLFTATQAPNVATRAILPMQFFKPLAPPLGHAHRLQQADSVSTCSHVAMQPDLPDSPIDLAEDLPDDVLARVLAHGYCSYLAQRAFWAQSHCPSASLQLLNGALPRAAQRRQDCLGKGGASALFWSARHGDVPSLRLLLAAGASPLRGGPAHAGEGKGPKYPGGECALSAALQAPAEKASGARLEALRLMATQLTPEERRSGPARRAVLAACEAGVVAYVSVLLDQLGAGPADNAAPDAAPGAAADVEGEEMPLLVALSQGFSEVAELILQDKAVAGQINLTLASGKSPLHLAAERGDRRVLQLLLRARATLDATTSSGRTALHLAVEHDYEQAVQAICENEATEVRHLLQETPNGASPVCLAERRGKPMLILPMLRCYHRHLRDRYLAGKLQDAYDQVSDPQLTALCLKHRDALFLTEEAPEKKPVTQSGKVASLRLLPLVEEGDKLKRYQRVLDKTRWSGLDGDLVGRGRLRSQLDLDGGAATGERKPWGSGVAKPKRPQSATSGGRGGPYQGTSCPPSSQLLKRGSKPAHPPPAAPPRAAAGQIEAAALAAEDEMEDLMWEFFETTEMENEIEHEMYSSEED